MERGIKVYICPTCQKIFDTEEAITKHSLKCWKEYNPNHKSKSAPHSEDIVKRIVDNDITNFFKGLQSCKK